MRKKLLFAALMVLSGLNMQSQNLLANAGFENGGSGSGFLVSGAGYTALSTPFSGTTVQGNYAVTTNPAPLNATYIAGTDHSGTGKMLIVDGLGSNAGQPFFWEAGNTAGGPTCGLTAGKSYVFSYWIKSVGNTVTNAATQADIRLNVTNATAVTLLSGNALAPLPAAGWQQVTYTFTASAACVNIGLWNNNTSASGNDFAIDDVALVPVASIGSTVGVCLNDPSPLITFTANVGTPPYVFTYTINTGGNLTVSTATSTATVSAPTNATGTFTYNLVSVTQGPLPGTVYPAAGSAVVYVSATPATVSLTSPSATANQKICIGATIVPITYNLGNSGGASVTGLPPGVSGSFNAGTGVYTLTGTPLLSGVFNYTVTAAGCGNPSANGTITIYPPQTQINLTSAAATTNQTLCATDPITPITYTVADGASGATVAGLPLGVTGAFNPVTGIFTISGSPDATVSGTFNYTVTTTGGCSPSSLTGTINVDPVAQVNLTSAVGTDAQTLCVNNPIATITYGTVDATGATVTGLPPGVTGTYAGGVVTISGTPTSNGLFNYTVTATGCGSPTATGTINVPNLTGLMFGSTTIMAGESASITFFGTPNATIYFTSSLGNNSVVLDSEGNGSYNIPYISATTTFTLTSITSSTTPSCSSPLVGSVTITVNNNTCNIPLVEVSIDTPSPVCNVGECTELLAHFSNIGYTSDYIVSPIPYCPSFPFTGGTVINATGDDSWSPVVALPFDFNFYGSCYNQVLVGTNGVITFDLVNQTPLGYCNWPFTATIPNAAFPIRNAIYGVYQDTNIASPPVTNTAIQNVNYYVLDTGPNAAPNRVFVANFNELPQFQCNAGVGFQTSQIVIHETTNIVEIFVNKRTSCTTWNSGSGLIGIQNQSGSLATVPPGRNTGTWSATNEAWRFLPKNIPPVPTTIQWFQGVTPVGAVNQNPVSVCPTGPTTYTAVVTYTNCAIVTVDEDILVDVVPPLPVTDPQNVFICTTAPGPYTVNIDQTAAMLASTPSPGNYWIKYYLDEQDAKDDAFNNIPPGSAPGQLGNYVTNGPFPLTIYVRIEDLVSTGCYNIRPLVIDVGGPSGSIAYPGTPYCNNLAVPQPVTTTNLTTGGTYSAVSVPPGNTLIINPATGAITPQGSPVGNYDVTYSIPANPPCPAYSTSAAVAIIACTCTVNASSLAETLCVNTALTPITYTNPGATSASITAGALPPGVTGSFAAGVFTVSGTPTSAGVYTITVGVVTPTDTCYATTTITVNPNATITLASAASTTNQTVCINTAIAAINYTIADGGTGATVTGLPTGVTGVFAGGTFSITGTPTVAGTFPYTVTTSGGCSTASLSETITVSRNVTIALTSVVGTDNQTLCINTAITNIVYTTGNGATGATVLGLPTGVTGSYAAGVFTISGTPSVAGTFNYTVTTTGGCSSASLTGTIIVNPNATISQTSAAGTEAQTVCINTAIASIIYAVANGGTGATVSGLPAGVTGTYTAGNFTISGTPTAVGTFPYTVTTTGGCSTASLSGTITVSPDVTIALTSAAATANQTVCINTAIANIVYTTTNTPTNVTASGLPTGVTGTFAAGVFTISGTPTVAGTFPYTVTTSGGCGVATLSGTITVNPAVTISLTSAAGTDNQTVCINTAITQITYTVANGATGATVTGLPAGITGVFNAGTGEFNINGSSATTGTFPYTVTTTGGCATASLSGTIIINPDVTIVLTSAAATANQTVCIASTITTITYTTANGVTGITDAGFPTGVTGSYNAATGVYTITGTPSVDGTFPYTLTTVGGCGSATIGGMITVNPAATIALTSAIGTDAQTVCINTAITAIQYTIGNGGTGATVLGLPAGVTGTYAGGVFTITGTPSAAGTFPYTVTTTGGCSSSSLTGTIIVNPDVTITLDIAGTDNQTVCINTAITTISYTIANNATGATESGMPPGVSGSFAAGVYTITGTPTAAGTYNYTITTTGGCSFDTATGTIIVNPNATIGQLSPAGTETQTLCVNTAITAIDYQVANGATGATATGLPAGVTGTFNAGTGVFTISGTPTVAGTFPITIDTTGGCSSAQLTATLNVNPNVTMSLTSAVGTDSQTVCNTAAIASIVYTTGNGATGATVTGLPAGITGVYNAATNTFTISGSTALVGTHNYSVTTTGGCSSVTLNGTIIISPDVTIALTSAAGSDNQTVCISTAIASIAYTTTNNATGATTTGLPNGVTGSFNAATGVYTLSGSPTVAGTFNYTVTTTGGCGSDSLSGVINVNPNATIALTTGLPIQTVCVNTPISTIAYTVADGATGATVTGLPAGVTGTFAGSVFTITGTPTVAGTFPYTVTTTGGCSSASLGGTITVNPDVTITLSTANNTQTVCVSTPIVAIAYAVANAGPAGATVTGLPAGVTGSYNATTGVYTISGTPTVAGTFNYTVNSSGGCSTDSASGVITVNPNVTIALTSPAPTASQVVCINTAITPVVFTVGNLATGASITSGGLPLGVTGTFNSAAGTFTITGTPTSAGIFNYVVSTSGGCSVATATGSIEVTPNATLTLTSAAITTNQTICQNTPIAPITYLTGNGATGATVAGLPAGVTGSFDATTGVFTISGTTAATALGTFNYTVTTTGGCYFAQMSGVIDVTPSASIALTSAAGTDAQRVCIIQESLVDIVYTVGNGATGASIVAGEVPVGISGSFNTASGTFIISGTPTESGTFTYTVRTSGGCSYSELTGTITVDPLPVITLPTDGYICVDANGIPNPDSSFVLTSGLPATGYTFEWSDANGVIPTATSNNLTVAAPGVYSVTATSLATGCFNTESTTVISSFPPLSVTATASEYFTQEQVVTIVALPIGNYEYQADNGPWQDGNQFFNLPSGEHHFLVRDKIGCGQLPASIIIIDYPKFFTPNNDGYNDTWNIDDLNLLGDQQTSKIEIFDRYGKLLKEISPLGIGWDGSLNGKPLPATDYWFKVFYKDLNGLQKEFKAHFSLKR